MKRVALILSLFVQLAAAGVAHANDWRYAASFYVFAAETETRLGGQTATLSFSEALENLDSTFMGSLSAENGEWGVVLDYMLTDVAFNNETQGLLFGGLEANVETQMLTGYYSRRFRDTNDFQADLLIGARWFKTDTTLTLLPGIAAGTSFSISDDWVDPVIGIRSRFQLGGKWSGSVLADIGGLDDRRTWQVLVTADYAFNDSWLGRIGYRQISFKNDEFADGYRFEQSGPLFGLTYQF